jgi:DMSO/TMAO reductase YedYZ molybdopterin-dependent catalytic subunit
MGMADANQERADKPRRSLPPGQRARRDFPRFGTHLHLPPPAVPSAPAIEIAGAVRQPFSVGLTKLAALPRAELIADFHCVGGWSATALRWEGIPFAAFYREIVEPALATERPTHLVLQGLDGYRVVEYLEDALADDVLLADRLDGQPLTGDHGAPLRFVSPGQYGYVSAKHLCRIEVWTEEPPENYGYAHPLGRLVMRPPFLWRHPRGRVWHEERNRYLPPRLLRVVYAPIRAPIRWLSARGSETRTKSTRGG